MSPAPWYKAPSPNKNRRYPGLCTDSQQEATRQGWSPAQRVESKWTDAPSIRCREKTGHQGRTQGRWERESNIHPEKQDHFKQCNHMQDKCNRKARCKKILKNHTGRKLGLSNEVKHMVFLISVCTLICPTYQPEGQGQSFLFLYVYT